MQLLLEAVDRLDGGMLLEVLAQPEGLLGLQVAGMASHQRDQPLVERAGRVEAPPQLHEALAEQAHDVEAVRHDPGLGEVPSNQGPVGLGEVDAHQLHLVLALQ